MHVLHGGLPAWEENGYPVYASPDYEQRLTGLRYTPQQVRNLVRERPSDTVIIDLREAEEYAVKHLPGALNVPMSVFTQRIADVPRDKLVILYCVSGGRSYTAIRHLRKRGFSRVGHVTLDEWEQAQLPVVTERN